MSDHLEHLAEYVAHLEKTVAKYGAGADEYVVTLNLNQDEGGTRDALHLADLRASVDEVKRWRSVADLSVDDLSADDEWDEIRQLREMLAAVRAHAQTAHDQTAELGEHVVQLRAELSEARELHQLSEAQLVEVTLERAEWRKQAQQHETVAKILRADLVAANRRAEEQAKAHDRWLSYSSDLESRLAESLDALTVAAELIDRLAEESACNYDHHDNCRTHSLQRRPCPHPLGRQFVVAWRAVEAEQLGAADDGQ